MHRPQPKHFAWLAGAEVALAISAVALMVLTGKLDSPYYSLWLLVIVLAGAIDMWILVGVVTITVLAYLAAAYIDGNFATYLARHTSQIVISLLAGALGFWTSRNIVRNHNQSEQVAKLSGQLSQEALKSEVIMQNVGEGILVVDTAKRILLFNPSAVKLTGWDAPTAQNIDYKLVLNLHDAKGEKLKSSDDPFDKVWHQGKSLVRNDLIMETKGGHKLAIELSLSPVFDNRKQIVGGIALFRDISAEKAIERQRNEFISTASHEMRTPVAAVEGYLSLAMNPNVATVDERAKAYLEKAHTSTQHLGELFRDLLSVTKLEETGKMDSVEALDLTALVKDVVEDMQFVAQKKEVELRFGAGAVQGEHHVLPVYAVNANPQRLREVVMNLIENAVKFTGKGRVLVSIGGTNDSVTVSVADTGIGIAPEDISHLFQKFYRIDSSATRTIGGTGLGLYLCRTIIELLGGRIWVESKQGEGSTFSFMLPRQPSSILEKTPTAPATPTPVNPVAPVATPAPVVK